MRLEAAAASKQQLTSEKETKLLQTIDRLKINANHENKDVRIQRTLAEMGKPKKIELKDGNTVEVRCTPVKFPRYILRHVTETGN